MKICTISVLFLTLIFGYNLVYPLLRKVTIKNRISNILNANKLYMQGTIEGGVHELIHDSKTAVKEFLVEGKISSDTVKEIVHDSKAVAELFHKSLVADNLANLRRLFDSKSKNALVWRELKDVLNFREILVVYLIIVTYKKLLVVLHKTFRKKSERAYQESFLGYIESPVGYLVYFFPFLYILDICSILLHYLGYHSHIKANVPRLLCNIYKLVGIGTFLTRLKDWYFQIRLRRTASYLSKPRDFVREKTVDELTSTGIWLLIAVMAVEFASFEFGFALSSILAVGGIGSASVALGLKNIVENFLCGLILRLEDKFRIGELISINNEDKGVVEDFSLLDVKIRKEDNSIVTIPNIVFNRDEVTNWSRTLYRLFKTTLSLPMSQLQNLPDVVESIRSSLYPLEGIETKERPLFVAASGFHAGQIQLTIELHFKSNDEVVISNLRTNVTNVIVNCVSSSYK